MNPVRPTAVDPHLLAERGGDTDTSPSRPPKPPRSPVPGSLPFMQSLMKRDPEQDPSYPLYPQQPQQLKQPLQRHAYNAHDHGDFHSEFARPTSGPEPLTQGTRIPHRIATDPASFQQRPFSATRSPLTSPSFMTGSAVAVLQTGRSRSSPYGSQGNQTGFMPPSPASTTPYARRGGRLSLKPPEMPFDLPRERLEARTRSVEDLSQVARQHGTASSLMASPTAMSPSRPRFQATPPHPLPSSHSLVSVSTQLQQQQPPHDLGRAMRRGLSTPALGHPQHQHSPHHSMRRRSSPERRKQTPVPPDMLNDATVTHWAPMEAVAQMRPKRMPATASSTSALSNNGSPWSSSSSLSPLAAPDDGWSQLRADLVSALPDALIQIANRSTPNLVHGSSGSNGGLAMDSHRKRRPSISSTDTGGRPSWSTSSSSNLDTLHEREPGSEPQTPRTPILDGVASLCRPEPYRPLEPPMTINFVPCTIHFILSNDGTMMAVQDNAPATLFRHRVLQLSPYKTTRQLIREALQAWSGVDARLPDDLLARFGLFEAEFRYDEDEDVSLDLGSASPSDLASSSLDGSHSAIQRRFHRPLGWDEIPLFIRHNWSYYRSYRSSMYPALRRGSNASSHSSLDTIADIMALVQSQTTPGQRLLHFVIKEMTADEVPLVDPYRSAPAQNHIWKHYESEKLYRRLVMLKNEEKKALDEAADRYAKQMKWIQDSYAKYGNVI